MQRNSTKGKETRIFKKSFESSSSFCLWLHRPLIATYLTSSCTYRHRFCFIFGSSSSFRNSSSAHRHFGDRRQEKLYSHLSTKLQLNFTGKRSFSNMWNFRHVYSKFLGNFWQTCTFGLLTFKTTLRLLTVEKVSKLRVFILLVESLKVFLKTDLWVFW